jgi:hypothetical protein
MMVKIKLRGRLAFPDLTGLPDWLVELLIRYTIHGRWSRIYLRPDLSATSDWSILLTLTLDMASSSAKTTSNRISASVPPEEAFSSTSAG